MGGPGHGDRQAAQDLRGEAGMGGGTSDRVMVPAAGGGCENKEGKIMTV